MGAAEMLGVDVGVVGVAVGVVGVAVGLAFAGDGDGDGEATWGGPAGECAAGEGNSTLSLGLLPGLADVPPPGLDDCCPRWPARPPWPFVVPGPPPLLEVVVVPGALSFWMEMNVPRSCPRAKTPATTSTTAPATARAGRS